MHPTMTYRQAFDKVTEAYFKGEIKPLNASFCFCGTLHGGYEWRSDYQTKGFSKIHYGRMEKALFVGMGIDGRNQQSPGIWYGAGKMQHDIENDPDCDNLIFNGMSAAIDEMRAIYIEEGWELGEEIEFVNRKKQTI